MTSVVQFAGGVVVFFGLLTSPKEVGEFQKEAASFSLSVQVLLRNHVYTIVTRKKLNFIILSFAHCLLKCLVLDFSDYFLVKNTSPHLSN